MGLAVVGCHGFVPIFVSIFGPSPHSPRSVFGVGHTPRTRPNKSHNSLPKPITDTTPCRLDVQRDRLEERHDGPERRQQRRLLVPQRVERLRLRLERLCVGLVELQVPGKHR